jgi:predicted nucleic acid-binding protein
MTKIIIDSSVYLSIFLKDSEYSQAIKLLQPYLDDPNCIIYLPTIIIAEVINVLSRAKIKHVELNFFIIQSISLTKFKIIDPELLFYYKEIKENAEEANIKTHDLIIYSVAKKYKLDKIVAIDKQLSRKNYEKN